MIYLILFLNTFLLYLYTSFPTIAAYRDSGELATVGYLLGIAHPPGYPLYTMLVYLLSRLIPFGNFAYRVNILSGIFSSFTALVLFNLFTKIRKKIFVNSEHLTFLLYFVVLCFSFGYLQWYLSLVSEMYTLNTFFASLVLLLSFLYFDDDKKYIYLLFFTFGLGVTNRLDLIFFSPFLVLTLADFIKKEKSYKISKTVFLFFLFLLGFSCYFYLPIRSTSQPYIDWNDPQNLERFLGTLTRKTHGSTLDLISSYYRPFENFKEGLEFYLLHLSKNLGYIGLVFVILGIKLKTYYDLSLFLSWFLSAIYFIYKANMPPNPHSLAILEAHFLLPNVIVWLWFMLGLLYLYKKFSKLLIYLFFIVVFILFFNLMSNYKKLNKRNNFYAYDYTVNVLRSLSPKSLLIVKEDVQVFSLWYRYFVEGRRKDISIIASGLSGSSWYQSMYRFYLKENDKEEFFIGALLTSEDWKLFIEKNLNMGYKIFVTYDNEIPQIKDFVLKPHGLLMQILIHPLKEDLHLNVDFFYKYMYILRDGYVYNIDTDFFCSDLIEDYSKALLSCGHWLTKNNFLNFNVIEYCYKYSIVMNPIYPYGYFELGYNYYLKNELEKSLMWYKIASNKFENYIKLAKRYKALTEIIDEIKLNASVCYLHLGVVFEKINEIEHAIENYKKALEYNPHSPDVYYNLAVAYWRKKDWEKVKFYLQKTLNLNPYHKEARFYLDIISQKERLNFSN